MTAAKMKKISGAAFAVLFSGSLVFTMGASGATLAHAEDLSDFESTSVEYDLYGVSSDVFDATQYPKNENGKHKLLDNIGFVEYAYSTNATVMPYYGLYFYVYNPTERPIKTQSGANVVNIATSYNASGAPTGYENVNLKLISATANNRFLKFGFEKQEDKDRVYSCARTYAAVFDGVRRYDIGGIQIWHSGDQNATDGSVSYTFTCSGFSQGCSPSSSEESTLELERAEIDTLELNAHHTYYRPEGTNGKDLYTQDSLNSVYFAVPKTYMEKYGDMSGIRLQYIRALTDAIFVTGSQMFYNLLQDYIGVEVGTYDAGDEFDFMFAPKTVHNEMGIGWENFGGETPPESQGTSAGFAGTNGMYHMPTSRYKQLIKQQDLADGSDELADFDPDQLLYKPFDVLNYLFYAENGDADTYDLPSDRIQQYMIDYTKRYPIAEDKLVAGKYHPKLFRQVDALTVKDIDGKDKIQQMKSQKIRRQSWVESLVGAYSASDFEFLKEMSAIQRVEDSDLHYNMGTGTLNTKQTSKNLYMAESDVEEFAAFYEENKEENDIYIVRYAVDEYRCAECIQGRYAESIVSQKKQWLVKFCKHLLGTDILVGGDPSSISGLVEDMANGLAGDTNAWLAYEYVYLNFDIIQVRFSNVFGDTVIPVVASPIDIVPDATHPVYTTPKPETSVKLSVVVIVIFSVLLTLPPAGIYFSIKLKLKYRRRKEL